MLTVSGRLHQDREAKCSVKLVMIGDLASGKTDMAVTSKAARERHRVGLFLHCSAPGPHARPSHGLCPGQEEFENIRVMSYEKADVFIVTYSVVDPPSFHSIRDVWWPEIHGLYPEVPVVLVGTNCGRREDKRTLQKLKLQSLRPVR